MVKNLYLILVIFLGIITNACENKQINIKSNSPVIVGVITLNKASVPISNEYIGTTEGSKVVEVKPQVSGVIRSKEYKEGSYVREGQLLFVIEQDSYSANLEEAMANIKQAEAKYIQAKENYNRILSLFKKNAVSRQDLDNAKGEYDSSKASLESFKAAYDNAKINYDYTLIRSPVAGFIGQSNFSIGNLVTSSNLLTVINKINPIYVNFSIPYADFSLLNKLQSLSMIEFEEMYVEMAYSDDEIKYKGKLIFVDKVIDKDTENIAIKAEFDNENRNIMPGQYVKTKIIGAKLINTLLIPQEAIINTAMGSMVITVDDKNIAQYKKIELGPNIDGKFIVFSGLDSGDRIIVEGINKVRGGSKVIPTAPDYLKSR